MQKLLCISVLSLIFSCREGLVKLSTGHNTAQTAFELVQEQTLRGEFGSTNTRIFLKVRLSEGAMLRAELSGARGIDSALAVFNPPDKLIASSDDNGSSLGEEIYPILLPAGESLIEITGKGADESPFTFFYRTFKQPSDVEREPNNSRVSANVIDGLHVVGFYGPEYSVQGKGRVHEQDCFVKKMPIQTKSVVTLRLSGVDGVQSVIKVYAANEREIVSQNAVVAGAAIEAGPIDIGTGDKFFVCVSALNQALKASRDYYDLNITLADFTQKAELEPNNSPVAASEITHDQIEGKIVTLTDIDVFKFHNPHDYPIQFSVTLESEHVQQLLFDITQRGNESTRYEDSAEKKEVADNIRLDTAENIFITVKNRTKVTKKNFRSAPYVIKIKESPISDESEIEFNGLVAKADALVDLTQKWGFINPLGDIDFYRLDLETTAERTLVIESKIVCRMRAEQIRSGKTIASQIGLSNLKLNSKFEKGDVIKLQCLGQKGNPAERAYRIALSEP